MNVVYYRIGVFKIGQHFLDRFFKKNNLQLFFEN